MAAAQSKNIREEKTEQGLMAQRTPDFEQLLKQAMAGDIVAYEALFSPFYKQLKSYGYRLMANRADAEDLAHDTYIKAFDKLSYYKGESSFKTWVFKIATNLATDVLRKRNRWSVDTKQQAKALCLSTPALVSFVEQTAQLAGEGAYEIKNHIDHCFTCMGKTLPITQQVILILKDIYGFSTQEVGQIVGKTPDATKHQLSQSRHTMQSIFQERCSLINKEGACHQCSELNGWFNPKQNQQEAIMALKLAKEAQSGIENDHLYQLRLDLIQGIDPLNGPGTDLMDALMRCDRIAMGEEVLPA